MTMSKSLPQHYKIVEALTPGADAAGRTSDWVSLKNCHKAWIVVHVDQGNAATIAITVEQATAVAGTSNKAITVAVPIWANEDCATSDTLVAQTAAVSFTTSAAVKHKQVIFEVDPAALDQANGFDCLAVVTGASNAANITSAQFYLATRYPQGTPPAAITN
jgi:hypothetical protein